MALDAGPRAAQRRGESGLQITGQIEVHQAIDRANLDLGIGIAGGLNQRIEAVLRVDLVDLLNRLQADLDIRVGQQRRQFGYGIGAALAHLAYVLGPQPSVLGECRQAQ